MITIDGSEGEGGGQMVRSSLSLAMIMGTAVTIQNVRARRSKPGLMRQHLTAVQAAAQVCNADVKGASVGSSQLTFMPRDVQPGSYKFDIGSAGSTMLVLQTLLPALLHASGPTRLTLIGGTHNPMAPPFEFFRCSFAPLIERLGAHLDLQLDRYGFYPAGGGRVTVDVEPAPLKGFDLLERGTLEAQQATILISKLPQHIAEREKQTLLAQSGWSDEQVQIQAIHDSPGPGNAVLIQLNFANVCELFVGFGQKRVRAEQVAEGAWQEASEYFQSGVPIGPHLADQWMLPLALAALQGRGGAYRTTELTGHSHTHLDILQRFIPIQALVTEEGDRRVRVEITR